MLFVFQFWVENEDNTSRRRRGRLLRPRPATQQHQQMSKRIVAVEQAGQEGRNENNNNKKISQKWGNKKRKKRNNHFNNMQGKQGAAGNPQHITHTVCPACVCLCVSLAQVGIKVERNGQGGGLCVYTGKDLLSFSFLLSLHHSVCTTAQVPALFQVHLPLLLLLPKRKRLCDPARAPRT